ncbi:uncharacterized protein LOC134738676 [Pongo pygmaeus]|uniref:uncharacterized protein LOC134738674 n=1 Tax=Pongo pygmaeus TaxID=9600 RepID=UPI00300D69D7
MATDGPMLLFAVLLEQPGRSSPPGRGLEIMGVMEGLRTWPHASGRPAEYPIPRSHSQKAHRFLRVLVDPLRPQHSELKSAPPTLTRRFNLRRKDEEYTRQSEAHPASAASAASPLELCMAPCGQIPFLACFARAPERKPSKCSQVAPDSRRKQPRIEWASPAGEASPSPRPPGIAFLGLGRVEELPVGMAWNEATPQPKGT